jgi:hypothetical protein
LDAVIDVQAQLCSLCEIFGKARDLFKKGRYLFAIANTSDVSNLLSQLIV